MMYQQIMQKQNRSKWYWLLLILLMVLMTACGGNPETITVVETVVVEKEVEVIKEVEVEKVVEVEVETEVEYAAEEEAEAASEESVASADTSSTTTEEAPEEAAPAAVPQTDPLRAGEVDDNETWADYLQYRQSYHGAPIHDRDISERYIIAVNDESGTPVLGAQVNIFAEQNGQAVQVYGARTYANGQVLFHPQTLGLNLNNVQTFKIQAYKNNAVAQSTLNRTSQQSTTPEQLTLEYDAQQQPLKLDVLFLIDATGSMADEIEKIQTTMSSVADRIDTLSGQADTRYGMVTYRDRGESFVSNTYNFTADLSGFQQTLNSVFADGGGDYPEALSQGLHQAVQQVDWRGKDTIQLIFLVADAPPHL
ncbi:MAG: vWA domain-containing protein, partial [Chloroflexota bacterium]